LTTADIPTWADFHKTIQYPKDLKELQCTVNPALNEKVAVWRGDITHLEIDAIVNAANCSLLGGGGVDGAIHRAASRALLRECEGLGGCDTGDAKLTGGHRLPAKYVLHTVGPTDRDPAMLESCYNRCLELVLEHSIKSVAFPCIATGVYGYPHKDAALLALKATREWLEEHSDKVDRIIFCVFLEVDYKLYCKYLHYFYPVEKPDTQEIGIYWVYIYI
jgi:O-acetyl-ADP-ribose deacetylase (regulator of RNase III)